ncbi:BC10, partial [Symbiodinium pilosum]
AVAKPGEPPLALPLEQFGAIRVPWVRTAWCALFGVEVATLFEALKDPTNAQFVFVSDSTVPLKNFSYVHKELMQVAPQSSKVCLAEPARFALAKTEMMKQESLRKCFFRDFLRGINPRALKHHQWLTLTRRHAAAVVVHAEDALNIYEDAWLQAAPDLDIGEGCSDEAVPVIALLASLTSKGQSSGNTWTDLTRLGVEQ